MLIFYEEKIKDLPITKKIFDKFWNSEKISIQHYKNLFDLKIWNYTTEPFIILAKQENIAILPTPDNYWFPWKSYFFKPSLNCFFKCKYCYLQWTFKNRFPVFFLNYDEMKQKILEKIQEERLNWFEDQITFYASNYADLLATEDISHFHSEFLPFCENLPKNVIIETRTKSSNIWTLLKYFEKINSIWKTPTQNLEIAFSLSPEEIAKEYELWTANINEKIIAINNLLNRWFRVWLRFLPLLPVENFKEIYTNFLEKITSKINIEKISSITIAPLIFNDWDYNKIKNKQKSEFPILNNLTLNEHNLRTCSNEELKEFEKLFNNKLSRKKIIWDYK